MRRGGQLFSLFRPPCCFKANLLSRSDGILSSMSNIYELGMQVGSYAVRDIEEYKNFCDRPKDQRPQPDEVLKVKMFSVHL